MSFNEWRSAKLEEVLDLKNGKSRPKEDGIYAVYGGNGILGYTVNTRQTDPLPPEQCDPLRTLFQKSIN
jgi:hypothetical protein